MSEREGYSRRFGFVFFDSEVEPAEGFASIAGGAAHRINSVHELSTDVIWWTNIEVVAGIRTSC